MKKLFLILLLLPFFAIAQKEFTHTVAAKESLSSIGRLYNINAKELASFNKIDYNKGLEIGQELKIPGKYAISKTTSAPKQDVPTKVISSPIVNNNPIYHTVAAKETLYKLSTLYKNATIADIKKWNNLNSDALSEGVQLIVGYNKIPKDAEVKKTEVPVAKKIQTEAVEEKVVSPNMDTKEVAVAAPDPIPTKKEAVKPSVSSGRTNTGAFANIYNAQQNGKEVTIENTKAAVFKSTSGWEDGKYYCLYNDAPSGTIIKVSNTLNGKFIFAKVLDLMPDIKQNIDVNIIISNAAADALSFSDGQFSCSLKYSK